MLIPSLAAPSLRWRRYLTHRWAEILTGCVRRLNRVPRPGDYPSQGAGEWRTNEVAMSIKGSVGRHAGSPRRHDAECRADDQKTVIDLLNRIPVTAGGAGGALSSGQLHSGSCSDELYHAIQTFENKQFPKGPHSGFVDPVRNPGKMLFKKMEELAFAAPAANTPVTAQAAQQPAAESPLDILRRKVPDVKPVIGQWTAGDRVKLDVLVKLALESVDHYKKGGDTFPTFALVFGWGYYRPAGIDVVIGTEGKDHNFEIIDKDGKRKKVPAGMNYGAFINYGDVLTTGEGPALVLFRDGSFSRIPSHATAIISRIYGEAKRGLQPAFENGVEPNSSDYYADPRWPNQVDGP
jgi:hypothetical protein